MQLINKNFIFILFFTINSILHAQQIDDICNPNITSFSQYQQGVYYKDINNNFDAMIGIWKNVTGNKTFKVTFFKVEDVAHGQGSFFMDEVQGHFMMIQNEGQPNETILYNSDKPISPGSPYTWPSVIQGASIGGSFGGQITDNCTTNPYYNINGRLQITKIAGTNTAHWVVTRLEGMRPSNEPGFTIPTDIILTKQ